MVELIYKQTQESFNTIIHYPYNPIKKDYKTGGISTATKIDGYTTKKLYYFTQETVLTDEENFKENYGNPLAEVSNGRRTVVVEKEGDKVRLSIYRHHKFRKAGKKYFAKAYDRFYLTYNLKTNNVYCTKSMKEVGYRGRRSVRVNNFHTDWLTVNTGLKQGCSLSPMLFNMYINDLAVKLDALDIGIDIDGVKCSILMFFLV